MYDYEANFRKGGKEMTFLEAAVCGCGCAERYTSRTTIRKSMRFGLVIEIYADDTWHYYDVGVEADEKLTDWHPY